MIKISNLFVDVEGRTILDGLNLTVNPGEIHSIMGPNGSGKSTLFKILTGFPGYEVREGSILYRKQDDMEYEDLLKKDPRTRAQEGIFMIFQHPVEVSGVTNLNFLRTSFNSICKSLGADEMDEEAFLKFIEPHLKTLNLKKEFLYRFLNAGLSGGEKKKNEMLQMLVLSPTLCLLDEVDSGLDIDSIKMVSKTLKKIQSPHKSMLLITHYHRLLEELKPDHVHILVDGKIKESGDYSLAVEVDKKGYDRWV